MIGKYFFIIVLIIFQFEIFPQEIINTSSSGEGDVRGRIIDSSTGLPVEYSNLVLLDIENNNLITGTVSDKDGFFALDNIPFGTYILEVRFIGFDTEVINVSISEDNSNVDLGEIPISLTQINLNDIVVEGQRSPISYQIDKKVIDVSQMQTVVSGNAADILENVPSVTVDIDGNVSLRGSGSFTVLIDGRPTVLEAQDALQQISANSIGSIEIITNPSAKYDPEGTAGIINIILNKERSAGLSGVVNANVGLNDKYGGDFLFEYRTGDVSTNFGFDYSRRFSPGSSREENIFETTQNTNFLNSFGDREWGRIAYSVRAGVEFKLGNYDLLSFGGRFGERESQRNSLLNYNQWSDNQPGLFSYISRSERSRSGNFFSLNSNYLHKFNLNGHHISSELIFSRSNSDEFTRSSEIADNGQFDGKWTTEEGPSTDFRGKIDYTLPLTTSSKFESGYQGQLDISTERTGLLEFEQSISDYEFKPQFSYSTEYTRSEHAFYSMFSNEWSNFGLQAGVRAEYTYRTIDLPDLNQNFNLDRWDFFPTLHGSYKFVKGKEIMASYTRRIERPRGWQLEPFDTWMDANNVRRGNPALEPEYIDSYEAGFQTYFGNISLSTEIYYKVTNNKIERIRSVYSENVSLNSVQNIGKDYSLGTELMLLFDPLKFWNVNLMGNVYNYIVEGRLDDQDFSQESFNWTTRINNVFKISEQTQFQINTMYNSPTVSSQGKNEGYFSTDIAVRQDLFARLLTLTLQVRDLFGTAKYEFTSRGADFYSYDFFDRESPMVMLNVRFNFNNFKNNRDRRGDSEMMGGDEF